MRILIPFLCLMLLASCHNQNDLKKIAELEKENVKLKSAFTKVYSLSDTFYQAKHGNMSEGDKIFKNFVINNYSKNYIFLNHETYAANLRLALDMSYFVDEFTYSIPQQARINNSQQIPVNENNSFVYNPNDTGWYYWQGFAIIRNKRTDEIRKFPIIDSFYVYK